MDLFFVGYRDPIFGLIVLFGVLLLVAILSYAWGIFSKKDETHSIEKFIKKFEASSGLSEKHKKMLLSMDIDVNSLGVLALTFSKSGDFDKSISVYLVALEKTVEKKQREFLLTSLGKIYIKAGFLKRASEVFLEAIKLSPRNHEALRYLNVVYEKLKMHKESLEVLDALSEQGTLTLADVAYTKALIVINSASNFKYKIDQILELSNEFGLLKRLTLEQFIKNKISLNELEKFPPLNECFDIIFHLDNAVNIDDELFKELFVSKGMLNLDIKINDFNLALLKSARDKGLNATLCFKYVCRECKNNYPLFFYRCPNCARLGSVSILSEITRDDSENSMSF